LFLGEYWTGATGDFQNVRARLWQLAHYGYFGPPIALDGAFGVGQNFRGKTESVEKLWRRLEEETEKVLANHSAEVHAVAQALLERNDLTGRECIEVIKSAATNIGTDGPDSEKLLKLLVEETIVSANGKSEQAVKASKKKSKSKSKAKQPLDLEEEEEQSHFSTSND
jgi:hypothetical protein